MNSRLFPIDLPSQEWVEFKAEGFSKPVSGVIYRSDDSPVCGVPLGGIDTGCLDVEATGLLGYSSIFNSLVPREGPLNLPFLGISIGRQTHVLTTLNMRWRDDTTWYDAYTGRHYKGVRTASRIHYWGHYPVADYEFITDCPVTVGVRAWAPFIPGDVAASNTPAAVFEVHLRNTSDQPRKGTLAFSFPGPSEAEAGTTRFRRRQVSGTFNGLTVTSNQASYALGVVGDQQTRIGGELGVNGEAWARIEADLPFAATQAGASLAVDFSLDPGEEKVVRFVLAWHSPQWMGGGTMTAGGNAYTHMYAARYRNVLAVARDVARRHASLLKRTLAWQAVIYQDKDLPPWLSDSLINVLHLVTETAVWAQAKPPIGDWCRPEDGIFSMNESPRWCPQMECIPCNFYGNIPILYFFPQLLLSTLRTEKAYQFPSGAATWVFGGCTTGTKPYELALPSPGYDSKPQTTLDGPCYADMVFRLWLRTGDDAIVHEFYQSVKENAIFTMGLRPGSGPTGIVSMPTDNAGQDWIESCDLFGIVPHIGGAHLAQLRMAKRMAEVVGDAEFAQQCQQWIAQGSAVMEENAWAGTHYMLFNELETGKQSDIILSCQLDGEWMTLFDGLEGVFRPDRVDITLENLKSTSLAMSDFGAVAFCKPGGKALEKGDWDPGYWGAHGVHPPGTFMLAMTYMYRGQPDVGLDLARRTVQEVIRRRWYWDWPVVIDGADGDRVGFDYYQNLMFWGLPAALHNQDLSGPCQEGGLVERIIRAGNKTSKNSAARPNL